MKEFFDVLNKNGEFTGQVATREDCHKKGLWHKAVAVFILSEDNKKVLLQQRSANKKLWPSLWDVTVGGHVDSGELGYQTVIRETKEELGIVITQHDLEFIGATTSQNISGDIQNNHFNEYYIVHKNINLNDVVLNREEVQSVKWFNVEELVKLINNNYQDLTEKTACWNYLIKYFKIKWIIV